MLLFVTSSTFLHHLFFPNRRSFSLTILTIVIAYSFQRNTYFGGWISNNYYSSTCALPNTWACGPNDLYDEIMGTFPEGIFLSIVSLTVSSLVNLVSRFVGAQPNIARYFTMGQHLINLVVYFWLSLLYIRPGDPTDGVVLPAFKWIIIGTEFSNAIIFVVCTYWFLIYFPPNAVAEQFIDLRCFCPIKMHAGKLLLYLSIICCAGLFCKAMLINVMGSNAGDFALEIFVMYFFFGELIPVASMLTIQFVIVKYAHNYKVKRRTRSGLPPDLCGSLSTVTEEPSFYNRIRGVDDSCNSTSVLQNVARD